MQNYVANKAFSCDGTVIDWQTNHARIKNVKNKSDEKTCVCKNQ